MKKNKEEDSHYLISRLTIKQSIQDGVVLVKGEKKESWNRIKNPEIVPNKYGQLILDKGMKAFQQNTV